MRSLRKVLATVLLVGASSTLLAQPGAAPEAPADPAPPVAADPPRVRLSLAEMQVRVGTLRAEVEASSKYVVQLQIVARTEKDVIRLNCINDKLLQIKALMNLLDTANADFESAVSAGGGEDAVTQYTRITVTAENVRTLREEADGCSGEGQTYSGGSQVEVTAPDIPDDPTSDPFGDPIEAPAYASPFN